MASSTELETESNTKNSKFCTLIYIIKPEKKTNNVHKKSIRINSISARNNNPNFNRWKLNPSMLLLLFACLSILFPSSVIIGNTSHTYPILAPHTNIFIPKHNERKHYLL